MLILTRASVTWEDEGVFDNLENARVIYHGNTVSIWERQPRGRYSQFDRLTDADFKDGGKVKLFSGQSERLANIGVTGDEARMTIRVKGDDGCPNC
jgi:hypothetical protein